MLSDFPWGSKLSSGVDFKAIIRTRLMITPVGDTEVIGGQIILFRSEISLLLDFWASRNRNWKFMWIVFFPDRTEIRYLAGGWFQEILLRISRRLGSGKVSARFWNRAVEGLDMLHMKNMGVGVTDVADCFPE